MACFQTRFGRVVPVAAGLGAVLGASAFCPPRASAGDPRPTVEGGAMQVLADVVLIESRCRQLNVDYGKLFAFAERNGIRPTDIMPAGERHAAFATAYQRRSKETANDRLCGALAAERDAILPGVFTSR